MAVDWTEFPERIETFGDLFSVVESFDRDFTRGVITSSSYDKQSSRSAYAVDIRGAGYEFIFLDRPGIHEFHTYVEREYGSIVTLPVMQSIRARVSDLKHLSAAEVNRLSLAEVVDALTEARRQPGAEPKADTLADDFRWLKVTEVANLFALNPGRVSKLADAGTLVTNGKTRHDRRIDVLSVIRWVLDRLRRQDTEDPATVAASHGGQQDRMTISSPRRFGSE